MNDLPDFEIIVGTYDEYLLGYQPIWRRDQKGLDIVHLKSTFADKSHSGSVKSLAVRGPWVATGGVDDRIFIYDMRLRKQAHVLNIHSGAINALDFSADLTHLMSAGEDGHLMTTRVGSWVMDGDWGKSHHGKPVTHLTCHPSSRLALTLGANCVMNTWNLLKGRVAYRTNLKSKRALGRTPECLAWSATGKYFSLAGPLTFEIWDIKTACVIRQIKVPSKPICATWLDDSNCLAGLENGSIAWSSMETDENVAPYMMKGHTVRVKCIAFMCDTVVTISSNGEIKMWKCDIANKELLLISSRNIECRPTCLALLDTRQFSKRTQDNTAYLKKLKAAKQTARIEALEATKSRSYVSIEYDEDGDQADNRNGNATDDDEDEDVNSDDEDEQQNEDSEEEEDEDEDEGDEMDSEYESDYHTDPLNNDSEADKTEPEASSTVEPQTESDSEPETIESPRLPTAKRTGVTIGEEMEYKSRIKLNKQVAKKAQLAENVKAEMSDTEESEESEDGYIGLSPADVHALNKMKNKPLIQPVRRGGKKTAKKEAREMAKAAMRICPPEVIAKTMLFKRPAPVAAKTKTKRARKSRIY